MCAYQPRLCIHNFITCIGTIRNRNDFILHLGDITYPQLALVCPSILFLVLVHELLSNGFAVVFLDGA